MLQKILRLLKGAEIQHHQLLILTLAIILSAPLLKPHIPEINSISEVNSIFEQATQEDLFIFDCDDVLFEPEDPSQQSRFKNHPAIKQILQEFDTCMRQCMKPTKYDKFVFSNVLKTKPKPIEKVMIGKIHNLQEKKIKCIALTYIYTGKNSWSDELLEEWRYKQLLSVELDFSSSFGTEKIILDELRASVYSVELIKIKELYPNPAIFYKGILCTAGFPKGAVLKAFLEKIRWRPAKIYFFDDYRENVESVINEMCIMGIPCQGYVYQAAKIEQTIDERTIQIIKYQYEWMKFNEDYLSYTDATISLEQLENIF